MNTEDTVREAIKELLVCEESEAQAKIRADNATLARQRAWDKVLQVIKASYGPKGEVMLGKILYRVLDDGTLETVKPNVHVIGTLPSLGPI